VSKKNYIFGMHAVKTIISRSPERVLSLYILQDKKDNKVSPIIDFARKQNIQIDFLKRDALDKIAANKNHQGVVASCSAPRKLSEQDLEDLIANLNEPAFLLILDGVQDPHNLGACLRSADAAGVHAVIAPKDNSASLTEVAVKVSSGASETVPFIQVTNLARTMKFLREQNIWLYGADADGKQTLYQASLSHSVGLVLGAEGKGLRRLTKENCDELLKIPMNGYVSSLNVSVATGIFLFEALRQRM